MNLAPVLPVQTNRTINELVLLTVTNTATDADLPANALTYTLENPPTGAVIDTNGIITWTPSEAQGPGVFTLKTILADDGSPQLKATNTFTVTVAEVNNPPQLAPIADIVLVAGRTLLVTNLATDPDLPPQTLTFSLLSAPRGATLDPSTGRIAWRPAIAQSPSTNLLVVRVVDNGTPVLGATQSFLVSVLQPAPPTLALPAYTTGRFSLIVYGDAGPDYIIERAAEASPSAWLPIATNESPVPPFVWWDTGSSNAPQGLYRVKLAP